VPISPGRYDGQTLVDPEARDSFAPRMRCWKPLRFARLAQSCWVGASRLTTQQRASTHQTGPPSKLSSRRQPVPGRRDLYGRPRPPHVHSHRVRDLLFLAHALWKRRHRPVCKRRRAGGSVTSRPLAFEPPGRDPAARHPCDRPRCGRRRDQGHTPRQRRDRESPGPLSTRRGLGRRGPDGR
jgi:hypothetical protein